MIDYQDNQPVIDLIASKPAGIMHILDDECNFPQVKDTSFIVVLGTRKKASVPYIILVVYLSTTMVGGINKSIMSYHQL